MLFYICKRLFSACIVILGVATLVFLLIHLVPGDPVAVMLGENAQLSDNLALRQALGLDQPLLQQWLQFISRLVNFDLGVSLYSKREITLVLLERLPATAILAVASMLVALLLALPLGIIAAVNRGRFLDMVTMSFSILGVSIPNFWLGPLLILLFSIGLGWFPVSGSSGPASLVLPAVTLGSAMAALLSRMIRSALLEVMGQDYMRAAHARGLSPLTVILRHGLPNALLPVITVVGLQFGALLAGAVITETIFSWPGIGQLTIDAIQKRDYPVVQACVLLISMIYVIMNLLTDLAYAWLDPRVRLE